MADILATWLNEEVGLSKVRNLITDCLRKYRTLSRISLVATSLESCSTSSINRATLNYFPISKCFESCNAGRDINTHRVRNFEKLEPTLRNLSIKFDSMTCDKIMKGERGYALRLLY